MKKLILFLAILSLSLWILACDEEDTNLLKAELLAVSGCNDFIPNSEIAEESGDSASVSYVYNSEKQTLSITHVNAAFNCCPKNVSADFDINDNLISISEYEVGGDCDCECLYDFDYLIKDVRPEKYQIKIIEPLLSSKDQPFDFTIDLNESSTGKIVLDRTSYPWH